MKRHGPALVAAALLLAGCGSGAAGARPTEPLTGSLVATGSSSPQITATPPHTPTSRGTAPSSGTASPTSAPASPSRLTTGAATVAVAVATVWRSPSSPRGVDAAALADPVRTDLWPARLDDAARRGLVGRADTQVLLGDRVLVLAVSGAWARVVVPGQPTPLDRRGYPGWVPVRQLTSRPQPAAATTLVVVSPSAWLRSSNGSRLLDVGFGTRLPGLRRAGSGWVVALPDGRTASVAAADVVPGALPRTAASVVASARLFLGLPYLWAGTSAWGLDCSGLTRLVYATHGVTIPRDADAQARAGRPVARSALRPGDLVFFASNGYVHHVAMYVGGGRVVQAPDTGSPVGFADLTSGWLAREYAGARRFLP